MQIEEFEKAVLKLLCSEIMKKSVLQRVLEDPKTVEFQFTGHGYYLDITHDEIPHERIVCSTPTVLGRVRGTEVGFVAFVEDGAVTLECHAYGDEGVPPDMRGAAVEVFAT